MKTDVHHSSLTKQGWEVKRLGEVLKKTETVDPTKDTEKEFIYLDVSSVNKETKEIEEVAILKGKDAPSRARKLIRENDIIFATVRPTHSRVALIPEKYNEQVCSTGYFVLRPKDFLYFKLVFYFILTYSFNQKMEKLQRGTSYPAVTDNDVKNIIISYPKSLPEQQRIVAILDQAFAAIEKAKANAEKNLQNAKALFESYFQSIFEAQGDGWEEKKLGDVLKKTETIDPTKDREKEFIYLDVSSVNKETKEIEEVTVLIGKDAPSRARKLIRTNDIIFATVRPTHSRVALITEEYNEQVCSTGYFVLRPKDFLHFKLVFYFLLTYSFNQQMEKLQRGTSYPAVTDNDVKNIIISYPKSITEQARIVKKLDALSAETKKLEILYQKKIADLEELKKSILNKAFNGELDPHPNPPPRVRRGGNKIVDEELAC